MTQEAIDANEAESSTSNEVQETPTDETALPSSAEGEPSDATEDSEAERSLLDIVQDVAKESRDTSETEATPTSEEQEQVEETATGDTTEQVEEELNAFGYTEKEWETVHDKTKHRMQELLAQRSEYKESADQLNLITGFMEENKISSDAMAAMMGSLAKFNAGDYQGFVDDMSPLIEHAGTAVGARLPEDIQQKVNEGYVDLETAKELAHQRVLANDAQHQAQREQFNAQAQQSQVQVESIRSSVDAWEADIKSKDVDYAKKEQQIRVNSRALMAQYGTPANEAQALQLAKDAYAMTNDFMKQSAPVPRAINPGPSSSSASNAHAEPKSMLDAVRLGIKQAHS